MCIKFDKDSILSNFYSSEVIYEGCTYTNAEACFHAQKCVEDGERKAFQILCAHDAWVRGRNPDKTQIRSDWENVKLQIMKEIVREKFNQNLKLAKYLYDTGSKTLIEDGYDTFWGMKNGMGKNNLGLILMEIREELKVSKELERYISIQQQQETEVAKLCADIYTNIEKKNVRPQFSSIEDELAYLILEQRYNNLVEYIKNQKTKYDMACGDADELLKLWFLYNDLKEIHYVGTDIYSHSMFVKNKVPYLYRSVGKDNESRVLGAKEEAVEIGKIIFKECLTQIKSGGEGNLYSYSKCFGKMLYKYANFMSYKNKTTIEIRNDAWINSVSEDGRDIISLQKFTRTILDKGIDADIPLFAVDMSNARENKVGNLKKWIDDFLGEQEYIARFNDIYDPIGDAEVVSNFTGTAYNNANNILCSNVDRYDLTLEEFCLLLYMYSTKYANNKNIIERFNLFVINSLNTIQNDNGRFKNFYDSILNNTISNIDNNKLNNIMNSIDWKCECIYMSRVKSEKNNGEGEIPHIDVYKGDNSESKSRVWKDILLGAIEGQYPYIDCSELR